MFFPASSYSRRNAYFRKLKSNSKGCRQYGQGYIHLTSRQGVEIPFIKLEDIDKVKKELAEGNCRPGASGPTVRTITACQGNKICSNGCIDAQALSQELNERYFGFNLPHKFKFGVTGCHNNCLKAEENDLGIKGSAVIQYQKDDCVACGSCESECKKGAIKLDDSGTVSIAAEKCINCGKCAQVCPTEALSSTVGFVISFGGLFGNNIHKGKALLPIITDKDKLFNVIDAAINFFKEHGQAKERFKFTIDRIGWDKFKKVIHEAYNS